MSCLKLCRCFVCGVVWVVTRFKTFPACQPSRTNKEKSYQKQCFPFGNIFTNLFLRFMIYVVLAFAIVAFLSTAGLLPVSVKTFSSGNATREYITFVKRKYNYRSSHIDDRSISGNYSGANYAQILRRYARKTSKNSIYGSNSWTRVSDEVFVYSAHLDIRNFTTYLTNNSNFSAVEGKEGKIGEVTKDEGQGTDERSDSDKLNYIVVLVRVVGIKSIPPLREFIKRDVLDWFRMKHEMEFSEKYECKLFFSSATPSEWSWSGKLQFISSSRVTYTVIEEGVKEYAGTYFNCYFDIENNLKTWEMLHYGKLQIAMYPKNVSDYPTKLIYVSNLMKLSSPKNGLNIQFQERTLAVCVRPLFGPFDNVLKLIQFISYYHTMKATQFNFYLMSVSPEVRQFLMILKDFTTSRKLGEGSEDENAINLLPRFIIKEWNLPTGSTSELWDYGTLAALNDCLFSNVDQEFVLFVDFDEFVVPQKGLTPSGGVGNVTLWNIIDSYEKEKTYQYLIRNTFFCHEFCELGKSMNISTAAGTKSEVSPFSTASFLENNNSDGNNRMTTPISSLPIFSCAIRTKRIWNSALRSKFIVNPRKVLSVGHHLVTKYVNQKVDFRFTPEYSVQVDPNIAVMNHYRECTSISTRKHPILTRTRERDETMLNFKYEMSEIINLYLSVSIPDS